MRWILAAAFAVLAAACAKSGGGTNIVPQASTVNTTAFGPISHGTLYIATAHKIDILDPPYRRVSRTIDRGVGFNRHCQSCGNRELTVSAAGALFVQHGRELLIYEPPYTGLPTIVKGSPSDVQLSTTGTMFEVTGNTVRVFEPPYTSKPAAILHFTRSPEIAVDREDRLIVWTGFYCCGDKPPATMSVYAPPYTAPPGAVSFPSKVISSAFLDSADHLFVGFAPPYGSSAASSPEVDEYNAPYTGPPIATITNDLSFPGDGAPKGPVAEDSLGDLFVFGPGVSLNNSFLGEYKPPYSGKPTVIGTAWAYQVAFGTANELFIANNCPYCTHLAQFVDAVAPPYTEKKHLLLKGLWYLSIASSGDLFAEDGHNVVMFAPPYSAPPKTVLKSTSQIYSVTTMP
jgi:hypothetical protein